MDIDVINFLSKVCMVKKKLEKQLIALVFFIGVFGLSFIASWVTKQGLDPWYTSILKPSFNPPSFVFGPVWTFLYIIIAWVGSYLWMMPKSQIRTQALVLWFIQMGLNFIWSFIFFGMHQIGVAFFELALLILVVFSLIIYLRKIHKVAFYGFILYLIWLVYALVLNYFIFKLNG